ncbi:Vi polysaccharide biosynthesis protein VipA/TviB [Gammaproteobacteria bacterium 45_16_T64]|nr:Vi polysaccharide biosynthesis protein VipA/TviB [Gammaproteobacteria bacterium 45_16_T64]
MFQMEQTSIAIIGLGYVGLPLAIEFGKKTKTIGFDINENRISELQSGVDSTLEVDAEDFKRSSFLTLTSELEALRSANVYIVTVPTPIDEFNSPDLTPLKRASGLIGEVIASQNIVIYESTVYPGCTEEVCVPIIEQISGLTYNEDFFAGYSPERINPGDKTRRLTNIVKVTSGSTPEACQFIDNLYKSIVTAGTHPTSSIKIAEAAKVIENTQRDVNIALVNELALIFAKLDIDTEEVLEAAGSKWNFLPFRPGLVGGHCISVDPYYLTHKAQEIGYHPEVILSGRRINDKMGSYVADSVIKLMMKRRIHIVDAKILIMGLSFKEDCPDLRNTRIIDVIEELNHYHPIIEVYDPWIDADEAHKAYGITMIDEPLPNRYDAVILCVNHQQFKDMGPARINELGKENHVLYDVKYLLDKKDTDGRL